MFYLVCFSLHRDCKYCCLLWKRFRRLNGHFSLFQEAADTRTLNQMSLPFFAALLYLSPFSSMLKNRLNEFCFPKCPDDFTLLPLTLEMHSRFYHNCSFLQCNNFFLVSSCIYHSSPLMTTWGHFA